MQSSPTPDSVRNLNVDLHCHTTASDGALSPTAIVARAIEQGVDVLAITDHDNFDGLAEAQRAAANHIKSSQIKIVSGIEFSSVWKGINIHIIGLDFNPILLSDAVVRQKVARKERAQKIAQRLEKQGVKDAFAGAKKFATSEDVLGRPQFAKYLVEQGYFVNEGDAFKKWLGNGKIGDVKTSWPTIQRVVNDINNAGGQAVLAHPHHYNMTNQKLGKLLAEFKACGGAGIEVCASGITPDKSEYFAILCERYKLMASRGSDFHTPDNQWVELGRVAALPETVNPIWQVFK